ncbi:MAG: hypothetical protein JOY54_08160 [Acidobacteriaceae bacterium]|nr:hypothetical protein [Acidobacteriaceae bacterium]
MILDAGPLLFLADALEEASPFEYCIDHEFVSLPMRIGRNRATFIADFNDR